MEESISAEAIEDAEARIRPYVRETYLDFSPALSEMVGCPVHFKCENLQHTGSFKVRGALNKLLSRPAGVDDQPVITASTGNHGAAVGYALSQSGGSGVVFVPETASPTKLKNIARYGIAIQTHGRDGVEAENYARETAKKENLTYISPYNDPEIVCGQGSIGVELGRQSGPVDRIYISLGGGGLISGVAAYIKSIWPGCRVIGCSPENSAVMIQSQKAGRIVDLPSKPTLSDGTAGGVEAGAITFDLCRTLVDEYVTVSEAAIADAIRLIMSTSRLLVEGAAGVAAAAMIQQAPNIHGQTAIVLLCGGNVDLETLARVVREV